MLVGCLQGFEGFEGEMLKRRLACCRLRGVGMLWIEGFPWACCLGSRPAFRHPMRCWGLRGPGFEDPMIMEATMGKILEEVV